MSHLLAYWRIYWDEIESGDYGDYDSDPINTLKNRKKRIEEDGWGAEEPLIQDQIEIGENLWVIGRKNPASDNWCLLLRLKVQDYKKIEREENSFQYRVISTNFDFFHPEKQKNLEPTLKKLKFKSGKKIPPDVTGGFIGKWFRNRRPLTQNDNDVLERWIKKEGIPIV